MYAQKRNIIIVCEGVSERAYIQELNRYLDDEDFMFTFIPKPSNGGRYGHVVKKYREVRKNNKSSTILIWVDWDRYQRNDNSDMENYERKPGDIPDFLFSHKNFEDFIAMHLDRSEVERWWTSCVGRNHFDSPSHSNEYIPAFCAFMSSDYCKGEIPITIDCDSLANLKAHQNDRTIPFKCDFADKLFELLESSDYE